MHSSTRPPKVYHQPLVSTTRASRCIHPGSLGPRVSLHAGGDGPYLTMSRRTAVSRVASHSTCLWRDRFQRQGGRWSETETTAGKSTNRHDGPSSGLRRWRIESTPLRPLSTRMPRGCRGRRSGRGLLIIGPDYRSSGETQHAASCPIYYPLLPCTSSHFTAFARHPVLVSRFHACRQPGPSNKRDSSLTGQLAKTDDDQGACACSMQGPGDRSTSAGSQTVLITIHDIGADTNQGKHIHSQYPIYAFALPPVKSPQSPSLYMC